MADKNIDRRSVLRMSGTALAALGGASVLGTAGASPDTDCIGCDGGDDGGSGGGGGSTGSPPSVDKHVMIDVSSGHVTAHSYLHSMGDDTTVTAWFNWGPEGEGLPNYTRQQLLDSTGGFCDGYNCSYDSFGSLDPGTYEIQAYVSNQHGSDTNPVRTFAV